MNNSQINISPLEIAAIYELTMPLLENKTISCDKPLRVCRDAENVLHVYGPDSEVLTIHPGQTRVKIS